MYFNPMNAIRQLTYYKQSKHVFQNYVVSYLYMKELIQLTGWLRGLPHTPASKLLPPRIQHVRPYGTVDSGTGILHRDSER